MADKPPWIYDGGPDAGGPGVPPDGTIKDLNDLLCAAGKEAVTKALELADRELQASRALARVRVEQLLEHLRSGGALHHADYAARFREAHRIDPAATRPAWLELERRGMSREAIVAVLNGGTPPVEPPAADVSPPRFALGKDGKPKATFANAREAITALGIKCRYDEFHYRLLVGGRAIERLTGELSDHVVVVLRSLIDDQFAFDPGREHTRDAAVQLCLANSFDPIVDYLNTVKWDGQARLETWLTDYLGADDTPLTRAIGRITLIAAVRRVRSPGCKFDQIVVLEGEEGRGKSTAIEALAGAEQFSDQTILTLNDQRQQEAVQGVWLYEIADLAGISKSEVEAVKAFASRTVDRARPAYGRMREDRPRRVVFFATTNAQTYLKSQTGNRRFWPVKVGRIDLARLRADRDQLWAEAAALEATGCSLTLPEQLWREAMTEQERRMDHHPWLDTLGAVQGVPVAKAKGELEERIATATLLTAHLSIPLERQNDTNFKLLNAFMRRLNWTGPEMMRIEGKAVRGYRRPIVLSTAVGGRAGATPQAGGREGATPRGGDGGVLAPGESQDDWASDLNGPV